MSEAFSIAKEKEFVMNFTGYYDSEPETNVFNISRKRIFLTTLPLIEEDYNLIIPLIPDLIESLYILKYEIDTKAITSESDLVFRIFETFCRDDLKEVITELVKKLHTISIEAADKNEELQFTDSMARLVVSISIICRLTIPFLSHYLFVNDIKKDEGLFFDSFSMFYEYFDKDDLGSDMDIAAKLNKLVTTNVDNTLYSDKVIWNYLQNISMNSKILTIDLFKRVVRDIIPKITINKSIISFLHVVLKRQLKFQFTQNIKINFKPISAIRTENESGNKVNPFTKIEQKLVRSNELDVIIHRETLNEFIKSNSVLKVKDELNYYMSNVVITQLQVKILNFYISKIIGSGINIFLCNKREFIELLMITHKWLIDNKFVLLSKVLLSTPIVKANIKNFSKGVLLMTIIESRVYEKLTKKYSVLEDKINEGKIIISFVGDILNTDFEYFPLFREPKDSTFSIDEIPLKSAIAEILTFIERL